MLLQNRIRAFAELGSFLGQFSKAGYQAEEGIAFNELFFDVFVQQIKRAKEYNGWFTQDNILYAFENWSKQLTESNLINWTSKYTLTNSPKKIAVIMAGNIPLVGFHDFLSVLIAGHTDSSGSREANMFLSEQRARSVRDAIASLVEAPERVGHRGFGPEIPVASNDTQEGRNRNRRIEVIFGLEQ